MPLDNPRFRRLPPRSQPLSEPPVVHLRLYVAATTPNSVRAQHNLTAALKCLDEESSPFVLDVIDVFSQPKRARGDGVVVTPTLILSSSTSRIIIIGDLSDTDDLCETLRSVLA